MRGKSPRDPLEAHLQIEHLVDSYPDLLDPALVQSVFDACDHDPLIVWSALKQLVSTEESDTQSGPQSLALDGLFSLSFTNKKSFRRNSNRQRRARQSLLNETNSSNENGNTRESSYLDGIASSDSSLSTMSSATKNPWIPSSAAVDPDNALPLATRMKLDDLHRSTPWVPKELLLDIAIQVDGDFAQILQALSELYPKESFSVRMTTKDIQNTQQRSLELSSSDLGTPLVDGVGGTDDEKVNVETTDQFKAKVLRDLDACEMKLERMKYYGSSKDLRHLENQIKDLNAQKMSSMKLAQATLRPDLRENVTDLQQQINRLVAQYISLLTQDTAFRESKFIDLHGYDVEQALSLVKAKILVNRLNPQRFHIITGRGKTTGKGVKIRPAIEQLLEARNLKYKVDDYGGRIVVYANSP